MISLADQWLRLRASTAWGVGLIPGQGTKIPHITQYSRKKKKATLPPATSPCTLCSSLPSWQAPETGSQFPSGHSQGTEQLFPWKPDGHEVLQRWGDRGDKREAG